MQNPEAPVEQSDSALQELAPQGALELAQRFIRNQPSHAEAGVLADLLHAVETESSFDLGSLYRLQLPRFEIAVGVLRDWRLQRYYLGEAASFGASH